MKRATLSATSLGTIAALLFASCSDIPPGQPGPFTNGAAAGGEFARAATVTSAESFATGSTTGTVAATAIVILAKHKATEYQRQVALAHAKVAIAHLKAKQARAEAPKPKPAEKKPAVAKAAVGKPAIAKPAVAKAAAPAKKLPRYIAVDTAKDEHTAPQAEKAVVIFDTETQEIVGNNVYDVKSTPPVGGTAKFETVTAEYVGNGG
ncbi:MAG TPA: hypothetical protein VEO95_03275 [Chthoniobacteraceae bacterium]|nr:hypothetical protein [Chthoniobacteraceae bacterium]